uniref:Probable cysteine--tRNA ligase, mitochondrial n=1 Tax=Neolamprologus brichardi TaxID=32507 RepID=A0A3Q4H933_NEOBR
MNQVISSCYKLKDREERTGEALSRAAGGTVVSGREWVRPSGFDTGLKTFNSLSKQKEPLILTREGVATWYSCGPTVYDHAHLGHASSYVRFDILQRILSRLFGITVVHAMVITDIDDKIIRRSWEENVSPAAISAVYEDEFKRDMLSLKVVPPAVYLRVTENVHHIVAFIEKIIRNGHAYATKEAESAPALKGKPAKSNSWTAGFNLPEFVIRLSADELPVCVHAFSSMFGGQLDIHSGGIDLAFPHHENEIAQSEAYHQCGQWANYFLHSGHLHLKGSAEKMSKSLKNYISIKDFLQSYSADEFRMFCLLSKYRSAIDYSDSSVLEARSTLDTISSFCHDAQAYMKGQLQCSHVQEDLLWSRLAETKSTVMTTLADDFDTPRAISALMNLVYHGNCQLQPVSTPAGAARSPAVFGAMVTYVREVLDVFGIDLHTKVSTFSLSRGSLQPVVEQLTQFRSKVREFALARQDSSSTGSASRAGLYPDRIPLLKACDALRDDLAPLGVLIKDRGATSTWEIKMSARGQGPEDKGEETSS